MRWHGDLLAVAAIEGQAGLVLWAVEAALLEAEVSDGGNIGRGRGDSSICCGGSSADPTMARARQCISLEEVRAAAAGLQFALRRAQIHTHAQ